MNFEIKSYQSVGSIYFGMTRSEVRQLINDSFSDIEFSPTPELPDDLSIEEINLVDNFDALDIQVVYDSKSPYACIAVILYDSTNPVLNGRNLFDYPIEDLKRWMELIDNSFKVNLEAIDFYGLGISLCTDDYDIFKYEPPKSIAVFSKEYLNTLLAFSND
jgi:hypothetical protein